MIIDGADLAGVLATPGIDWKKTFSNHTPKVSFTKTIFKILQAQPTHYLALGTSHLEPRNGAQMLISPI